MPAILIIEDEPQMRLGLKDNLEFEGYNVDFAEDGEEGLQKIQEGNYNVILLDVMLPKLSGFDVCKKRLSTHSLPLGMWEEHLLFWEVEEVLDTEIPVCLVQRIVPGRGAFPAPIL